MPSNRIPRYLDQAFAATEHGNYALATEIIEKALAIDPESAAAYACLADCLFQQERNNDAQRAADTALEFDPDDLFAHFMSGTIANARLAYKKAESHFQRCMKMDPEYEWAYLGMAWLELHKEDEQGALRWIEDALTHNSEFVDAVVLKGQIQMSRGRAPEANHLAKEALRIDPEDCAAHQLIAETLVATGDATAAQEHAIFSLRQNPRDRDALILLAKIKSRQHPLFAPWWGLYLLAQRFNHTWGIIAALSAFALIAIISEPLSTAGLVEQRVIVGYILLPIACLFFIGWGAIEFLIYRELKQVDLDQSF